MLRGVIGTGRMYLAGHGTGATHGTSSITPATGAGEWSSATGLTAGMSLHGDGIGVGTGMETTLSMAMAISLFGDGSAIGCGPTIGPTTIVGTGHT